MFENYQFSGLLLCYGPLALVIVGFIAFAALTDMNARRSYLRQVDAPDAPAVGKPLTAQTPAGMVVTLLPQEPVVETRAPQAIGVPDNLQRIEGIGPKINRILQEAGIITFGALAQRSADELRAILTAGGMTGINDPTTWPEQAALAARGEWEALEELQDRLKGGRKV
jgi:predicted flap endonuclease-1-like 5' DNA nuclease